MTGFGFSTDEREMLHRTAASSLSQSLARELGAKVGDSIVVQLKKPSDIPLESLHSKKEDLGKTLRLTVGDLLDADSLGEFSIQPQQTGVRAIFISLQLLQRELEQPDKVNLVLVSGANDVSTRRGSLLSEILRRRATLSDSGIHLRPLTLNDQHLISVEHDSKMLDDSLAKIVEDMQIVFNFITQEYFPISPTA